MLKFPKMDKGIKCAVTRLEKVQNTVAAAALAVGLLVAGAASSDAQASMAPQQVQPPSTTSGSLILTGPAQTIGDVMAYHYSHSSHASHHSHHSHYSSRY